MTAIICKCGRRFSTLHKWREHRYFNMPDIKKGSKLRFVDKIKQYNDTHHVSEVEHNGNQCSLQEYMSILEAEHKSKNGEQ
jgi:hypothetical protein